MNANKENESALAGKPKKLRARVATAPRAESDHEKNLRYRIAAIREPASGTETEEKRRLRVGKVLGNEILKECSKTHEVHISIDSVKSFLHAGGDVNARDAYGFTPLFYASKANALKVKNTLLMNGAEPGARQAVWVDTRLALGITREASLAHGRSHTGNTVKMSKGAKRALARRSKITSRSS